MNEIKNLHLKYNISKRTLQNYLKNMPGYIIQGKRNRLIDSNKFLQIERYLNNLSEFKRR
jgi:hypothetical protein